jgi:PAS domain S-box-containing protein
MQAEPQSPKSEEGTSGVSNEGVRACDRGDAEAPPAHPMEPLPDHAASVVTLREAYEALARETQGLRDDLTRHRMDETRFRRFFDLPLIGMAVTSRERRFLEVNEKLCQILGYRREQLIGRDWASITHPDDLAGNVALLHEALGGKSDSYSLDKRYIHREGHIVYVSISVCCVRRSDGTADHFVLTVQDMTARYQAEEELRRLEWQLRQAQRLEAMGTLAGGIAHDFNNILGAILGYGEMALRGARRGSRLRRDLDGIMTAGERGRALIERILAFSRSGVGERVAVHVEQVVGEALDLLAAKLPAGVDIERQLQAGRAAVLGDPTQVHQVLMNLATNAIQAMTSGGTVRVSLQGVRLDAARVATVGALRAGDYLVLEVADSGTGMSPDILERIFDPFFTTKEVGVGTGLGLSLVHGIVTELGGAIDVTSKVGEGSVFTVYLPRGGDADDDREREEPEAPHGDSEQVLIVDDEEPLVRLATETLAELGYVPVGFTSSAAALDAFRAHPERFDAVITDERMPGMSGTALIREIRGIRRAIPILLVSGYVGGEVVRRALESGADEVLKKPLSAHELATSLARVLHA